MPRRLVHSTLVYFGLAAPPRRDDARLSDTALVIRWVLWVLLIIAVVGGVSELALPFAVELVVVVAAGLVGGLLLRAFERWATRRNAWPD